MTQAFHPLASHGPSGASARRTWLLAALAALSAACAALALPGMSRRRDASLAAAYDLTTCRAQIAEMRAWRANRVTGADGESSLAAARGVSDGQGASDASANLGDLHAQLRSAASATGVAEKLSSVEPGQPSRLPDTDLVETPVFLRFESLTMRQLWEFLARLTGQGASTRAKEIELSAPAAGLESGSAGETWTADVTITNIRLSPRTAAEASP